MKDIFLPAIFLFAAIAAGCGGGPSSQSATATSASPQATAAAGPAGVQLIEGFGIHHHPIRTSNPEAQKFFEQGMAMAYGFNHESAIRSFERAAELDPKAAMPQWGRAWALGPNYNLDVDDARVKLGLEAISQARTLAADGPAVERDYVEAVALKYSADPKADRPALARKFSEAMGALSRKYPDDLDAATLYAESMMNLNPWKLWSSDGKPNPGTEQIIGVLESVLRRDPNHLGANHLYIHAVEASPTPGRALQHAARLDTAAPASGHLVHMPAHIYGRTGDHASAAKSNASGAAADEKYLAMAPPDSMYAMMYYSHNLAFLADSHMMQGRYAEALPPAMLLAERLDPHAAMLPMVESMIVQPVAVLLRFNKHDEVLKRDAPPADRPVQTAFHHYARGIALARTGKHADAAAERRAFANAAAKIPESALWGGGGFMSAKTAMELAGLILDARLAWAANERDKSIQLWQRAVAAADRLPYDEPPDWYYPVRESLGAALLMAGKPADAERVFREDLNRNPRNPRSLFGLQAALAKQGRESDAAWVQREFEQAWKNADASLTVEEL